jgi:hypothetical protein
MKKDKIPAPASQAMEKPSGEMKSGPMSKSAGKMEGGDKMPHEKFNDVMASKLGC